MAGVELEAVAKRYARRDPYVLRSVDLTLAIGSVVHVRGTNGSGKSTLLRILAGVSSPTAGRVRGRPRSVGFVPERFPPAVRFTARDYLSHLAAIRRTEVDPSLELVDRLGAATYLDRPMTQLSKGSCQKVALSQALAAPPGLLVLDEAWTGLDANAQAVLTAEVRAYADAGGIVVLTDHARRTGDLQRTRHLLVAQGEVVETDRPRQASAVRVVLGSAGRDQQSLDVEPAACDALLRDALATGWSVIEVRR